MATQEISILGALTKPDTTGDVFFEPYSVKATNDNWDNLVLVFNEDTTRNGIYGVFRVPQNYVDSANIIIQWTSTATTGVVAWDFDYRAIGGDDAESLDQATAQESANVDDTAPTATDRRMTATIALTDANLAAGDTVEFFLVRDGSDADDTMAAAAIVFEVLFQYADA